MHDTPTKLQEICLDSLCDSVLAMCMATDQQQSSKSAPSEPAARNSPEPMDVGSDQKKIDKDPEQIDRIPYGLSDQLLCRMSEKSCLNDETLLFFDANRTTLKHVQLTANRNTITSNSLGVLADHNLESLSLRNFKDTLEIGFDRFVAECLNEWTKTNLIALDVRGTFAFNLVDRIDSISKLSNLRSLTVADTPFDDACLMRVCADLPHMESLDISHTKVKDLGPLLLAKDRLRVLFIHRPRLRSANDALDILVELHKLEAIDISDFPKSSVPVTMEQQRGRLGVSLVSRASERCIWRSLKILDMSGDQANFDTNEFRSFLSQHPSLEFMGLLMTNACFFDCLETDNIKVAGDANKAQILTALETYFSRDYFCSRSMYLLFNILQQNDDGLIFSKEERIFCIEQVLRGLKANFESLSVQMAGTACLYNLCRGERATVVHPSLLRQIVESSLTAIERHVKTPQLHKNVWLTLCNDHVLQTGAFDMFRCCTAALDSMVRNTDSSITRMTVAIISILAAKIPTEMTTRLGTNQEYMRFLLRVVTQKAEVQHQWYLQNGIDINDPNQQLNAPQPDVTLKFTLSALWNLTDESPQTCRCLLEEGGLEVVIRVLDIFHDHSIETKVLGLLNNVAEVHDLKSRLLSQGSLDAIGRLLRSSKIDVSYFAAGILAHLCADQEWNVGQPTREDCLYALEESISQWIPAETEMVAYRSFKPFFSLLAKSDMPAVQLWAVWAIRHVCSKNVERYVDMFKEEGGKDALQRVLLSNATNTRHHSESVRQLIEDVCKDILNILS